MCSWEMGIILKIMSNMKSLSTSKSRKVVQFGNQTKNCKMMAKGQQTMPTFHITAEERTLVGNPSLLVVYAEHFLVEQS